MTSFDRPLVSLANSSRNIASFLPISDGLTKSMPKIIILKNFPPNTISASFFENLLLKDRNQTKNEIYY